MRTIERIILYMIFALLASNLWIIQTKWQEQEKQVEIITKETIIKSVYYERGMVNEKIKELQAIGRFDDVIALYGSIGGGNYISSVILINSLAFDVPVNISHALCKRECDFDQSKTSHNRSKGNIISTDYGLFGLNSRTFKALLQRHGEEWLMKPENNAHLGIRYLRELYDKLGSWDEAIVKYNGRFEMGAKEHLIAVYEHEREFDRLFNEGL